MSAAQLFPDACAWQRECGSCANVLKSADDKVWRCSLFRSGRTHVFAITARDDKPGRCGFEARLYRPNAELCGVRSTSERAPG